MLQAGRQYWCCTETDVTDAYQKLLHTLDSLLLKINLLVKQLQAAGSQFCNSCRL
jgi:hypothetical protein